MAQLIRHQVRVRVQGELPATWSGVFSNLSVAAEPDGTTLVTGELADQAALHGFLATVRDLGLSLISVETVATHPSSSGPERRGSDGRRRAHRPQDGGDPIRQRITGRSLR